MTNEEVLNLKYVNFVSKLKKYGIYTEKFENDMELNDKIKFASASINKESGLAYDGALMDFITRIAVVSFNLNNILNESVKTSVDSLIKVCYISQLSKALMIEKNDVDWEVKKGKLYKFSKNIPALKTGEYSIFLCTKYGIELTEDEFTAILSIDKVNDEQTKYFSNSLSQVLRSSIEIVITEKKLLYKANNNDNE